MTVLWLTNFCEQALLDGRSGAPSSFASSQKHTSPTMHCETAVLELLRLHLRKSLVISGLQTKRIKSNVTGGAVCVPPAEESARAFWNRACS
jgi:hypothetical protein